MKQLAGLLVALIVALAARFGIEVPAEVQHALNEVLTYVCGILTALAGAKGVALAKSSGDDNWPPSGGDQSGFASPNFLLLIAVVCIVLAMLGCAGAPKPYHTIAATSTAIEQIAIQVDLAQKEGRITNEHEDHLMDELSRINDQLRSAMYLVGDQQQTDLRAINEALIELRAELAKEQKQ